MFVCGMFSFYHGMTVVCESKVLRSYEGSAPTLPFLSAVAQRNHQDTEKQATSKDLEGATRFLPMGVVILVLVIKLIINQSAKLTRYF